MKRYVEMASPLGELLLVGEGETLCGLYLAGQKHHPARADCGVLDPAAFSVARQQLQAYFNAGRSSFDLPLAPAGTPFQQRVWAALSEIPFGQTWTYAQLAQHIGQPGAARAVGLANGRNPIAIIVPCHRVVGADGSLTGYAGGLERKRWLLMHEQHQSLLC